MIIHGLKLTLHHILLRIIAGIYACNQRIIVPVHQVPVYVDSFDASTAISSNMHGNKILLIKEPRECCKDLHDIQRYLLLINK